jgi:TonB-dependent receptor
MKTKTLISFCFGLLIISGTTKAQQVAGKILGADGFPLPNAVVKIVNSTVSAISDLSGYYFISNKNTGLVSLQFSYIGYQDSIVQMQVVAGVNNLPSVFLKPSVSVLGEIIVKGSAASSQIKALVIKKNAKGIMDVLAADAIGKLPDRNAAEAIQRLPGVSMASDAGEGRYVTVRGVPTQWTASLLNGNHIASALVDYTDRRIQMDVFPSELIEYVQLSKAITPDIEGDNIGGSVNFITRSAPLKRILSISAAGGYGILPRKGSFNGSLVYGDRFFNNKLGLIVSAVIWDRDTRINRYNIDYNISLPNSVQSFSMQDLQLRDYQIHRSTTGYNAGLEYNFNANNKIYFKGQYSQFNDGQKVREEYFNYNSSNVQMQTRQTKNITHLSYAELGGSSKISEKFSFDWNAGIDASTAKSTDPETGNTGYPIVNFIQKMTYDGLSSDGRKYLKMDSPNQVGDEIDNIHPGNKTALNADSMFLNQVLYIKIKNSEENKRTALNLNYTINSKFSIKAGGKFQHKYKTVDNFPLDLYLAGLLGKAPALSTFNREPYPYASGFLRNLNVDYSSSIINHLAMDQVSYLITPDAVSKYKLYAYEKDSATNKAGAAKYYNGTEDCYAGYLMATYDINSNFTIIGGFRNEYNNATYNSSLISTNSSNQVSITAIKQKYSYDAFLPMLHLKYKVKDNNIFRLSYTRSYARPDFGSLNPATTQTVITTPPTITRGNPDLKPTFSNNYDFMFEHYFKGAGLFTAGAFYKDLTNFIYTNSGIETINGVQYVATQPRNLDKAWLYGFEVGISKRFLKLPGFWSGLGIEGNYTYVNSETKIPRLVTSSTGTSYVYDATTLPQQSKHVFNAILVYERKGFMARIAGNYKGTSVFTINAAYGTDHYVWAAETFTIDFSTSYAFTKKLRAFMELNNITNNPTRFYMGTKERAYQAAWYGVRGQMGLIFKL